MNIRIEKSLSERFKDQKVIRHEELRQFFNAIQPQLNENTLNWRIFNLKRHKVLASAGKGIYTLSPKADFVSWCDDSLVSIISFIQSKYTDVKFSFWQTGGINQFTVMQSFKDMKIVEVEKELLESVFYQLKDNFDEDVFLNPDSKTINYYINDSKTPIIVKGLISRSPLQKQHENGITFPGPRIEKLLVDIFSETDLFHYYHNYELINIFEGAFSKYNISLTTMLSYAQRRHSKQELTSFLTEHKLVNGKDLEK